MFFLIVDDNRLLCRFFCKFLQGKGHHTHSINRPELVMDWLAANPARDAIVVNIGMPEIDGITLTSIIRTKYPTVPIVIFSGLGYDEDAMQASRQAGANGYVSKGLGPSGIYSALMRVVENQREIQKPPELVEIAPKAFHETSSVSAAHGQEISDEKDIPDIPENLAGKMKPDDPSTAASLRLCFLVSPDDQDWSLDTLRMQARLARRTDHEVIDSITFERRDPSNSLLLSDRRENETICVVYHASCEASLSIVEVALPEFVCLLRISGGTFEVDPPPAANKARHFHFVCPDLDYASWLHWLGYWLDTTQFSSSGFVNACSALQKCSDVLLQSETLRENAFSILSAVQGEIARTSAESPVLLPQSLKPQIESCAASFDKIYSALEDVPQHERLAPRDLFLRLSRDLRRFLIDEGLRQSAAKILKDMHSTLASLKVRAIDYHKAHETETFVRGHKHDINNTLAVVMALAELGQRNPAHYRKLAGAILARGPHVIEQLRSITVRLRSFSKKLWRLWNENEQRFVASIIELMARSEVGDKEPGQLETVAKNILSLGPAMVESIQEIADKVRRVLLDNTRPDSIDQVVK